MEFRIETFATGHADVQKQSKVTTGAAYDKIAADVIAAQGAGMVFKGTPVFKPEVTAVEVQGASSTATLVDCLDITNWKPIIAATGVDAAQPGQVLRYVVSATAVKTQDSAWRISEYTPDRSRTC
ncbi:hypothetical protein [Kitasatospora herbaricolor]|uniref:hypothetical protein n=1 Tax=Kitasatospora herbaricolor TaxID=68217 RepID=UPI0036D7EEBB